MAYPATCAERPTGGGTDTRQVAKLFGDHGPELTAFPDPARDVGPGESQARTAVLAGGCFWCTEAVFLPLDGVVGVTSGYIGGAASAAN